MKIKASLLVTTLLASTSCFAADTFQVSSSVYSKGKLVASPIMVVEADKMASITIDNGLAITSQLSQTKMKQQAWLLRLLLVIAR